MTSPYELLSFQGTIYIKVAASYPLSRRVSRDLPGIAAGSSVSACTQQAIIGRVIHSQL
jgi:hypothetical protein